MIRIGILGFAHGHIGSIAGQWKEHPEYGVELVCGWDHDSARGRKNCDQFGLTQYDTVDALLQSGIDAVIITSETNRHAFLAEQAAAAKKNIILYKPMALTMEEADRIVRAVEENGVRFTMAWQMRTDPQNQKIRQLIQTEELGKPCLYRRRHALPTHIWPDFENTWHADPVQNRDIFADDSAHPFDMMQWIFGMPESVSCEMSTMINPKIPNDNAVALFKYASGMIAEITCSFTCSASEITTEVYCSNGTIQQYFGDNPGTRLPRNQNMPGLKWFREGDTDWTDSGIPSPAGHGARLGWQAKPPADFLLGGDPICTAEEGRNSLRLVLACYVSAREGRRVPVSTPKVYEI